MDLTNDQLLGLSLDAAATGEAELPPTLVERVLSGARRARPGWTAAWEVGDPRGREAAQAFVTTAGELGELVDGLAVDDWDRRTRLEAVTVRDLVRHLVGVERYMLGQVGGGPAWEAPRREDHWPVTRRAAADVAGLADRELPRLWWREVLELLAACGRAGPDHPVTYHHLAGTVRSLLVTRTFELWTHGDDIRQAIGEPLHLLDEARLGLMVGELMGALPWGMALAGTTRPDRKARFDLTGPGGGTFDVPLTPEEDRGAGRRPPDVTIRTGTVELCRLAANRLSVGELPMEVSGDGDLVRPVLVGAGAFAAD